MQYLDASAFLALPAPKAKAAALALFDAAMIEPAADWRGVAFALHAVVSRKRGAGASLALDEIAMGDAADASEFVAWADYPATGKAANIARGRVTVTFADGWTKTVGMLAGKTAKGRKPWSIAAAVRFAVVCYKIAAVRRATGSDAALYFHKGGQCSGETITLDALVAAPEIVSVISADSAETVEGDLIWSPDDANAFTLDQRAGLVHIPLALAPMPGDIADALREARQGLLGRMGLIRSPMFILAREAAARVEALLFPNGFETRRSAACDALFSLVWGDDRDAYPEEAEDAPHVADVDSGEAEAVTICHVEVEESPALSSVSGGDHGEAEASPDDADAPAYDGDAYLVAMEIVGAYDDDAFGRWLAPSTWSDRRINIEDALIAWPGEVETMEPREATPMVDYHDSEEGQSEPQEPDAPVCATHVAETLVPPVVKPRYRFSHVSGAWEIIPPAGVEIERIAA